MIVDPRLCASPPRCVVLIDSSAALSIVPRQRRPGLVLQTRLLIGAFFVIFVIFETIVTFVFATTWSARAAWAHKRAGADGTRSDPVRQSPTWGGVLQSKMAFAAICKRPCSALVAQRP